MLSVMFENIFGLHFVFRWLHVFFAILWIGLLYYFNFVQGPFMAEADAAAKSQVLQKLLPRALWWFRWAAMWTFVTGVLMLSMRAHVDAGAGGLAVFEGPYWVNILTGALLATLMFLNVWLVIWPNQKVVIANAVATAAGQPANPQAAGSAARALVASRTNTAFSIPMMMFMLSASHMGYPVSETSKHTIYWALVLLIVAGIEANALFGKTGPLTTIRGVITSGFVLTAVFIGLISALL